MNRPKQTTLDVLYEVVESDPYHRQFRPLVQEITALRALLAAESARLDWFHTQLQTVHVDHRGSSFATLAVVPHALLGALDVRAYIDTARKPPTPRNV